MKRDKQIIQSALRILKRELAPRRVILFGSRAKGHARPHADFDIAVDARVPSLKQKLHLEDQLETVAGLYRIDLVFLSRVSKAFRRVIENTGDVLYEH